MDGRVVDVHEQHPIFIPPTNPEVTIWRYMDLPKLVAMLCDARLWFARADTLGDSHEGAYGSFNVSMRPSLYSEIPSEGLVQISEATRKIVRHTFINCWHMADVESVAMWRVYAPVGQGVAVRSTYSRLISSLKCPESVFVGTVRYVDPAKEWIPEGNSMGPFLHKRRSFEYERELRALMTPFPGVSLDAESPAGHALDVDLSVLLEAVYVAPAQPSWFRDAVRQVVEGLGSGHVEVRQSDLDSDPLY